MTKQDLIKKIEEAGDKYGKYEDAIIVESAHHACIPGEDATWEATAYRLEGDIINVVSVYWDFSTVENYEDYDDNGLLPWADESIMSADDNENRVEEYDLTDADDIRYAASGIER